MIIGLTGKAGVGKDTVAGLLTGYRFSHYAFAKPLKQALAVLGLKEPETREEKEASIPGRAYSYRRAAQLLGTEWARSLDPDFWVRLAEQNIRQETNVVVTDVRFENEARFIRSIPGAAIWHIVGRAATTVGEAGMHASEQSIAVEPQDVVLSNSGTLVDLSKAVSALMEGARNGKGRV
jgi:hypothetical protein